MELSKYVGLYVKVDLKNDFYYYGKVLGASDGFISLKDKNGKLVDISIEMISFIREVNR